MPAGLLWALLPVQGMEWCWSEGGRKASLYRSEPVGAGFALPWLSGSAAVCRRQLQGTVSVCGTPRVCVQCLCRRFVLILWNSANPRLSLKVTLGRAKEPLEVWVPYLSVFVSFAQLPTSFALTKQDGVYCLITKAAESGLVSSVIVVSAKKQN